MSALQATGALVLLAGRCAAALPRRAFGAREVLTHTLELGNRSALLVCGGMAFFGYVMVHHAALQAGRILGDFTLLGPDYLLLLVREFGPTVSALLLATRAGAGIAAELAAMSVSEQLEALTLCGGDPIEELVTPRVLGGMIAVTAVTVIATAASALSAALTASVGFGANGAAFLDTRAIGGADLACGLTKALLCGAAIPLCAARAGLAARGGAHAVGEATTNGVVSSCVAVIAIDFAVGALFLWIDS